MCVCVCVDFFRKADWHCKYGSDYTRMHARDFCTGCVALFTTGPWKTDCSLCALILYLCDISLWLFQLSCFCLRKRPKSYLCFHCQEQWLSRQNNCSRAGFIIAVFYCRHDVRWIETEIALSNEACWVCFIIFIFYQNIQCCVFWNKLIWCKSL
jgi:hypothetical protein